MNQLAAHKNSKVRPFAAAPLKRLNAKGERDVDYAQAKLEAGVEVEETKAFLRKISEDYAPLECSKKAAEVLERWASER